MEFFLATNNGDMGGGEAMLLNIARAARALGHKVTIVGPSAPGELIEAAGDEGFTALALPAKNRQQYLVQLRVWSARIRKDQLLWCNGLLPSVATAGQKNRIVHLHQIPERNHRLLAKLAKRKALKVLVPSDFAASKVEGSETFHNWVQPVRARTLKPVIGQPIRVGFLGRPSDFKGTQHLAQALARLNAEGKRTYQLVIGGESRFVSVEETKELRPALASLGENLVELGWTTPENYFSQIHLSVVPSNWDEVFGLVTAESMSAGAPLIVSDAGALPEVVGEGYPYIVPQASVDQLAHMIETVTEELLDSSPLLENTMQQATWRWQELFSPEAGKARVAYLLESLAHK